MAAAAASDMDDGLTVEDVAGMRVVDLIAALAAKGLDSRRAKKVTLQVGPPNAITHSVFLNVLEKEGEGHCSTEGCHGIEMAAYLYLYLILIMCSLLCC